MCLELTLISMNLQLKYISFSKFFRREDYESMENITEVVAKYVLKHSSTRWLTLKYVTLWLHEQWENICEYFLKSLSKQKTFNQTVNNTKRYERIREKLKIVKIILHFEHLLGKFLKHFFIILTRIITYNA